MNTTLQLALKHLIEDTARVKGDVHGVLCATIMLELWHEASGRSNCNEIMNTAITHAHRQLAMYENRMELKAEEVDCVHQCLDDRGVARSHDGEDLSLWGRVCKLADIPVVPENT